MRPLNEPNEPFFDDPFQHRLLAMIMSLGPKVAGQPEELSNVCGALAEKGRASATEINGHTPSVAGQAARDRVGETLVAKLLSLQQACDAFSAAPAGRQGQPDLTGFHPKSPDVAPTDFARLRFMAELPSQLQSRLSRGNRSLYETRLSRPGDRDLDPQQARARRDELRREMEREPYF